MKKLLSGFLTALLTSGLIVATATTAQAVATITPSFAITGPDSAGTFTISGIPLAYTPIDAGSCTEPTLSSVTFDTEPATGTITVTPDYVAGTASISGDLPVFEDEALDVDIEINFTLNCDSETQLEEETLTDAFDFFNAPAITSISPTSGISGSTVTFTGTDLSAATAVKFGSTNATSFDVVSDTSITAEVPNGVGVVDVTVTAHGETATYASFTYSTGIVSVSPGTGDIAGGQTVTLTGIGFTDSDIVLFGTTPGTSVNANTDGTQLTVVTPAKAAGIVDITVTNGTSSTSLLQSFRFIADPTITDFSPKNGPLQGGTIVTVTGTNFFGDSDELTVLFGTVAATDVSPAENGQSLTAVVPAMSGNNDTVKVTVTTKAGTILSSSDFEYRQQTITTVSPQYGPVGGGNIVTITGTNLLGATEVKFGSNASPNILSITNTVITAVAPAGVGTVAVSVKIGDTSVAKQDAYTYLTAPSVTSITPNIGAIAGGTTVTITGTNLKAISNIDFGVNPGTSVVINSAGTSLTVVTPARVAVGLVSVTLTGPGGVTIVPNGFEYVLKVCTPSELGKIRFAKGSSTLTDAAKDKLTDFSSAIIASGCDVVTVKRYKSTATTAVQKAMATLTAKRVKKALKYLKAQLDAGDVTVTIERLALANQKITMTSVDQFKVNRRIDFGMKS
ncbi:MAG: IPT/TIG domain-containing protein [Candidatus Nanopelagicales bacterium]